MTGAILLIAACASNPPAPTASLVQAKVAIAHAETADASHYAGAELDAARQKLLMADAAVSDKSQKSMALADRLAQEARVEAELASARTEAAKAAAINQEMSRGADALTEEMQRAGEQR
jgi:hypothetical protein